MKTTVSFENINNKQIFQIFTENDSAQKTIIIMSHGFRGSSIGPARTFVEFEKLLLEEGFSVLRFDQPCCGNSDGDFINVSFNEWIDTTTYFAEKYLALGYKVTLLGQSMGATTTMIVAGQDQLKDRIPCIILWVPDAKSSENHESEKIYEEDGQQFKGSFWNEAKQADFFKALSNYPGGIHLVYGETDKYVSKELRERTIEQVALKSQPHMVLPGQDHSSWDYDVAKKVFQEELRFLQKYLT